MFSPECLLGIPFPVFEAGYSSWENQDHLSLFQPKNPVNSNSGSDELNRTVSTVDDRKLRRMISNRESARRSRMRKQRQLEDLRNQVKRLIIENRDMENQLELVTYQCRLIRRENDRLCSESIDLQQRLSDIRRSLIFWQLQQVSSSWPCNSPPSTNKPPN